MKNTILLTIALLIFVSLPTSAQVKTPPDGPSVLYQIYRKDLAKPSYIFGTIHAICATEMVALSDLDPYLDQTDQMLMEVDLDDPAEIRSMVGGLSMPGGKTLKDFLTAQQFAKVDALVTSTLGYSVENVKTIKPFMVAMMIITSPKVIGCTPNAYDLTLMQKAVGMQKTVIGLETAASQIAMIDVKPIAAQARELYEMSLDLSKSTNQLKELMSAYRDRNSDKLFQLSADQLKEDKHFGRRLLDDRNIAWISKIETTVKAKPTFIAVGAAHLGGGNGVIALMRAKGYEIRPIKLSPAGVGGN